MRKNVNNTISNKTCMRQISLSKNTCELFKGTEKRKH